MGNEHLNKAKHARNDEFYTQLSDIELELAHYQHHLKGKHVYCNCDNPAFSKFWEYFHTHFTQIGLKQLTATYFDKTAFTNRYDYYGGNDDDISNAVVSALNSHGDFRSPQCTKIMQEADIVITNPPFSLIQQYVMYLNKYTDKFIFIGPMNTIHYKEVFPLIKAKKLLAGVNAFTGNTLYFVTPADKRVAAIALWYTNLIPDVQKPMYQFDMEYDDFAYLKYDNYDAVEIGKISDIPDNYFGLMGVPLSFFKQLNYNQFDLVDITRRGSADMALRTKIYTIKDAVNYGDLNVSAVLIIEGTPKIMYDRLLIKRKR